MDPLCIASVSGATLDVFRGHSRAIVCCWSLLRQRYQSWLEEATAPGPSSSPTLCRLRYRHRFQMKPS